MSTLFNDDNSDSDAELKINTEYASIYDNFRQKEELHKLKARYGENVEHNESSDSSSSSENEGNNIQNPQFEKEFLITLACLKNEDPRIYDKEVKFFSDAVKPGTLEDTEGKEKGKKKKEKTLSIRDYERKIIMERDGRYSSSEDEDYVEKKAKSGMLTYVEEQKQLKDSFKNALKDEDEDENSFLKIKQKTEGEKYKEEESYKEWLKGQEVEIDPQDQEMLKPLRDFWMDPNLDANEKFLRDYILNNKHGDNESYDMDLEYNQIAHDSDENLSEDEKTIQKQEEFERKYNFRFEEPDQEFIKRYPRTMENSMRKKDTRRTQKRIEIKERKEQEKQRKREELKQLKALKRKEIEEKIEKLKEITGNDNMCFDNVDFDADFDPNEHDKKMRELFNDEYYAGGEDEDQKPEFPEIEESDIESSWDKYDPTASGVGKKTTSYEEPHCEDSDFNMDADYDESQVLQSELIENTKKRKRRRRSKFAELIAKEKPKFDPKQFPSYEKYFDEYYSLDYEDMIGDMPCRFKYRKVVPNNYGLSVEEILMADERELNKWCSLKQALKHKPEHIEKNEVRIYEQKARNEALKQKILKSLYIEPKEEKKDKSIVEQIDTSSKKRRKKKKSKVNNLNMVLSNTDTVSKNKILDAAKNSVHNNSHNSEKYNEKDNEVQDKNVINNSQRQKRKNKLNVDGDIPIPKKMKIDNEGKKDSIKEININNKIERDNEKINKARKKNSQIKAGNINIEVENNIKVVNNNEKIASICKLAIAEKKNKNSQLNEIKSKKSKAGNAESIMSLNTERLKTYGINAKKFKNKLKYGNKQF